jgi:uncharacterized protein VirK/YbjX
MVFNHLARHWLARRHYPLASWLACIARSSRVLLFYRDHRPLLRLDVYRNYLTQVHDDVFHHLSHRNYLAKGLSLRQRVRCVHTHYRFECASFDAAYQRAVYRDGGLVLWRHEADDTPFTIQLGMAERLNAEGDLTLTACAGGKRLHRLSFSWVDGTFAGVAAPMLPFIARNQGHRADDAAEAFAAFEQAFPQNSPSFFCFAALQGLAEALGMDRVAAVKAAWQCAYDARDGQRFANAYDAFWQTLGGVPLDGRTWQIGLPLQLKPLTEMTSRHRKRAMQRRAHWRAIADAARAAILPHLLPQRQSNRNVQLATNA